MPDRSCSFRLGPCETRAIGVAMFFCGKFWVKSLHKAVLALPVCFANSLAGFSQETQRPDKLRPDILVADFEGDSYGEWQTTGEAFGPGPAKGRLPGQMAVDGFLGKGLVNSFFKGDNSTGTLTSPPFTIQRNHIAFLISGGKHPEKACINLVIDRKTVRTATGANDNAGGSEALVADS